MVTLCDVRKLGDFIQSRIFKAGFKTVEDFARQIGVGKPTVYRFFERENAEDADVKTQPGMRERIASGLRFREWSELIRAWEADDVLWGLQSGEAGAGTVELSSEAFRHAQKQAKKRKMDVAAWVEETIMPGARRVTRPMKSGEGAAKPKPARPPQRP